jgi:DUF1365 family protein
MTRPAASIYRGKVTHVRHRTRRHRLSYRVFAVLLDLDRLEEIASNCRLFRYNRAGPISFHDRDHGDNEGTARSWLDGVLDRAGMPRPAQVELLCYPRLFGYVFNPLSVYFCRDGKGDLLATVHEVRNTFGGRHAYVLPTDPDSGSASLIRQSTDKVFLVSPFNPVTGTYRFAMRPPADAVSVVIRHHDCDGPVLDAAFAARREIFSSAGLLRAIVAHPFMTHTVVAAIHWEAFKLWLKGVPFLGGPGRQKPDEQTARELQQS